MPCNWARLCRPVILSRPAVTAPPLWLVRWTRRAAAIWMVIRLTPWATMCEAPERCGPRSSATASWALRSSSTLVRLTRPSSTRCRKRQEQWPQVDQLDPPHPVALQEKRSPDQDERNPSHQPGRLQLAHVGVSSGATRYTTSPKPGAYQTAEAAGSSPIGCGSAHCCEPVGLLVADVETPAVKACIPVDNSVLGQSHGHVASPCVDCNRSLTLEVRDGQVREIDLQVAKPKWYSGCRSPTSSA